MLSDLAVAAAPSAPIAAWDGPTKQRKSAVAGIKLKRPWGLMSISNLPICQLAHRKSRTRCSQRGKKRESWGSAGRNRGSNISIRGLGARCFGDEASGVSQTDRCYEAVFG